MRIPITYEEAYKEFPTQLNEVVAKLRQSRSMQKNDPPRTIEIILCYSWSLRNRDYTMGHLQGFRGKWRGISDTEFEVPEKYCK